MRPAILQTDVLNSVAFDPEGRAAHLETFYLSLSHPQKRMGLALRFVLCAPRGKAPQGSFGEVQAVFVAPGQAPQTISQRFGGGRIQVDPERAGVGIGECSVMEGGAQGLLRGDDFAISWDFTSRDHMPGYHNLPGNWLHRLPGAHPKLCTPHPSGQVVRGRLEIWQGLGRHVDVTRIDLRDWACMQGHRWGRDQLGSHAWVHCSQLHEASVPATFEAFCGSVQLGRMARPQALVGRLVLGDEQFRFNTWRNLFGGPSNFTPSDWQFSLHGPQGEVMARVQAAPDATAVLPGVATHGPGPQLHLSPLSSIELQLQPRQGPPRRLVSQQATYEVCLAQAHSPVAASAAA